MRIERRADGSLIIDESWTLLRASCAIGACLLPAALFLAASGGAAPGWRAMAGGAIGSLVLLAIAAFVDDRRFVFEPSTERLSYSRRNWVRSRSGELPFSKIRDVVVTSTRETDSDPRRRRDYYQAVLVTEDESMPLTATSSTRRRVYDDLADAALTVLTGAGQRRESGTEVERLVTAGRVIDAIALIRAQRGLTLEEAKAVADEIRNRSA